MKIKPRFTLPANTIIIDTTRESDTHRMKTAVYKGFSATAKDGKTARERLETQINNTLSLLQDHITYETKFDICDVDTTGQVITGLVGRDNIQENGYEMPDDETMKRFAHEYIDRTGGDDSHDIQLIAETMNLPTAKDQSTGWRVGFMIQLNKAMTINAFDFRAGSKFRIEEISADGEIYLYPSHVDNTGIVSLESLGDDFVLIPTWCGFHQLEIVRATRDILKSECSDIADYRRESSEVLMKSGEIAYVKITRANPYIVSNANGHGFCAHVPANALERVYPLQS